MNKTGQDKPQSIPAAPKWQWAIPNGHGHTPDIARSQSMPPRSWPQPRLGDWPLPERFLYETVLSGSVIVHKPDQTTWYNVIQRDIILKCCYCLVHTTNKHNTSPSRSWSCQMDNGIIMVSILQMKNRNITTPYPYLYIYIILKYTYAGFPIGWIGFKTTIITWNYSLILDESEYLYFRKPSYYSFQHFAPASNGLIHQDVPAWASSPSNSATLSRCQAGKTPATVDVLSWIDYVSWTDTFSTLDSYILNLRNLLNFCVGGNLKLVNQSQREPPWVQPKTAALWRKRCHDPIHTPSWKLARFIPPFLKWLTIKTSLKEQIRVPCPTEMGGIISVM